MCGRYALFVDPSDLAEEFGLQQAAYDPTYNAAPSQSLPVVLDDDPETLQVARWGLVPSWSGGPKSGPDPINARAETLTEKRVFRDAYRERRCLVPATGFYEWVETADGTQPRYFSRSDERSVLMAGLWETWTPAQTQTGLDQFGASASSGGVKAGGEAKARGSTDTGDAADTGRGGETIRSFTVVTTEANDSVSAYHDRMPVVLDRDGGERWLAADEPSGLLESPEVDLLSWPVSTAVNNPSNDHAGLVTTLGR